MGRKFIQKTVSWCDIIEPVTVPARLERKDYKESLNDSPSINCTLGKRSAMTETAAAVAQGSELVLFLFSRCASTLSVVLGGLRGSDGKWSGDCGEF